MNTQLREFESSDFEGVPGPEEIREILAGYPTVDGAPAIESRSGGSGGGPGGESGKGRGPGQNEGGDEDHQPQFGGDDPNFIRGSSTIGEALKISGKTEEQFEKDWNISVRLGERLRDVADKSGAEMRELREYFGQKVDH